MLHPNRSSIKFKVGRKKRPACYSKMMKTLLLQNQQIIIQQQNMMFMVMKQFQPHLNIGSSLQSAQHPQQQQQQQQSESHQLHQQHQSQHLQQQQQHLNHNQQQQQQHIHQQSHHQVHIVNDSTLQQQSHPLFSQQQATSSTSSALMQQSIDTQQQLQQVANQLREISSSNYLTPAASEQDPINDKQEEDDLADLLGGDGLLHSNLLYNPQADIGPVTPYKSQQAQDQTPSYYSSGCESLTTPRVVEPQKQATTTNISQNVVKNLADSFKSPTKPNINVQILSGSATGSMKNSKAKIIQRMNISEFLRHVHPETGEPQQKTSSQ